MKHFFAFLVFFPIVTIFLITMVLEMLWRMLHAFHYHTLQDVPLEETLPPHVLAFLEHKPAVEFWIRFLYCLLAPIELFFKRLKEVGNYRF